MSGLREQLEDYVLGVLPRDEVARVREALDDDPQLRREHKLVQEAVAALSFLADPAPADRLRERLLRRVSGTDRFLPFVDALARLFDVAPDTARSYLDVVDEPRTWTQLIPGIAHHDFEGGPATAGGRVGMVRIAAGQAFPMHTHRGVERALILQGATQDGERIYRPGDVCEQADGSRHTTPALGSHELIYAVVVRDVEIEGFVPP
jgi:anti-sigma factor RsiW